MCGPRTMTRTISPFQRQIQVIQDAPRLQSTPGFPCHCLNLKTCSRGYCQKGQKGILAVLAVRARGHFHKKGPIDMQIRQNGGFVLVEGRLLQISQTGSQQPQSIVSSAILTRCACGLLCGKADSAPLFAVGWFEVG